MKFKDLNIIQPILQALEQKGYETPTPIQEAAIPVVLNGEDLLGCAQTGTGKTAAFSIPIIQQLVEREQERGNQHVIRSLIVTPTRELAIQIGENIQEYSRNTNLKHTVVFGGVNQNSQVRAIRAGVDILIATPGRLLDLMNQGFIKIQHVEIFVLDEADRMLDMGFINDIKKLLKVLPKQRQSLFFSATMPKSIVELSNTILNKPKKIEISRVSSAAETVTQKIYYTNKDSKKALLYHILEAEEITQVLVFSRTKHGADRIAQQLGKKDIQAAAIHGDKAQNYRQKVLSDFKDGKLRVLVATDIAARGIDIDKLAHVINYDIPDEPETYVHRIGRCGRAGETGVAISMCEPEENKLTKEIEFLINKDLIPVKNHPFPQTEKPMNAAEKKEFNKEKARRKQAFFADRKKNDSGGGRQGGGGNRRR
ncbi:MAG: ATP-dependent RNA helicase RhlE [Luteibaculaceae bacterium]|jgi:ATP-dependent RNA helicase RhlE